MNQTIRQQTQLRSPLVHTAERGLAKPADRLPRPRLKPRPLDFIIDGTACTDDNLTARFPRTSREAFGHYHGAARAPQRLTFLPRQRGGWLALVAVIAVLAFFVITGGPK